MTWKIELGIAGLAVGATAMWAANASPILEEPHAERYDSFTQADYQSFDRNFDFEGSTCDVGLRSNSLCFSHSPLENALTAGDTVPSILPDMPAEFPVIVKTNLKTDGLETWRFGRTLYLVRRGSREIVDVMNLDTPWQEQQGGAVIASVETGTEIR